MSHKIMSEVVGETLTHVSVAQGTLGALLLARREETEIGLVSLNSEGNETRISYAELADNAARLCAGLHESGLVAGDRVLLQLETAAEAVTAFWACALAGVVPIPLNTSISYQTLNPQTQKLIAAWAKFEAPKLLVSPHLIKPLLALENLDPLFTPFCIDYSHASALPPATEFHKAEPNDPAVMFLTSGSTGNSKGVVQTHAAMLSMADATIQMNGFGRDDVTLNWMSLDHAGSLVFLGVMSMAAGCQQVHVPVDYVLKDPARWLDLIHKYRASISWAPNFAFSLYLDRQAEFVGREWDLSCMRFMVNAGEAIVSKTARRFIELLEKFSLPVDALRPAFGMVETCSGITWSRGFSLSNSRDDDAFVDLGPVIPGAAMRIVDDEGKTVEQGESGRLLLRGPSVFTGYQDEPHANVDLFVDGWMVTGDLAYLKNDHLFITGREKDVIIINGNNFYSHEIEGVVSEIDGVVREAVAACGVRRAGENTERLALFYAASNTLSGEGRAALEKKIRGAIANACGVTATVFVCLEASLFPRTEIGKIKRPKLVKSYQAGEFEAQESKAAKAVSMSHKKKSASPRGNAASRTLATQIAKIWAEVLELDEVDYDETFFELGGHSLLAISVQNQLEVLLDRPVSMVELFNTPTINTMADYFSDSVNESADDAAIQASHQSGNKDIAVVGIGCRFPGANGAEAFWKVLEEGLETIRFFSPEEAIAAGVPPSQAYDPAQVNAAPILDDVEGFDLGFWGISQREAELIDPQQRVFLETAWEAFEDAGYRPSADLGRVGVYAAAATNTYLQNNVYANKAWVDDNGGKLLTVDSMDGFNIMVANDKDYLPTRVSYKLDLVGPSILIQTACSSTLVAVHEAFKSLRAGECEMAVAGGCALMLPQYAGHLYEEGMINTPDGHCRAYDAQAKGTIFGSGSAAVVLKTLDAAIADGDQIYAVIKGGSIANDGGQKMGFTAPSMLGEYRAIAGALNSANVSADTIGFVEGHGTGTLIGDPIEVQAMTKAFRRDTEAKGYCALGSVKTNIGHMGIASGIAGFIKTVLALHHKKRPGTLHFDTPNPAIDFDNSPFYVTSKTEEWERGEHPRRAGVNSLGIGGTNVHMILEEAPEREEIAVDNADSLILLSAHDTAALVQRRKQLANFIQANPQTSLSDIAFTLQVGRAHLPSRSALVANNREELVAALSGPVEVVGTKNRSAKKVFSFSGQGSQYLQMGRELYESQPSYRDAFDACCLLFAPFREKGIKEVVFAESPDAGELDQTEYTQPALFCVQVALVQLYRSFAINPDIVIGHSIGEVAAAWTAGVMSLEDAVRLVEARGRLMQSVATHGTMASINASVELVGEAIRALALSCEVAGINSPSDTTVSGEPNAIETLCKHFELTATKVKRLTVSHAFHSQQMDPILKEFEASIAGVNLLPPQIPLMSNVTGVEMTAADLTPAYWARQIRCAVRFEQGLAGTLTLGGKVFVEIGPSAVLSGLGRLIDTDEVARFVPSIRHGHAELTTFGSCLGALFESGAGISFEDASWNQGKRVSLPGYPWQRERCWIEPDNDRDKDVAITVFGDPLFHRTVSLPRLGLQLFAVDYAPAVLPVLGEHLVFGRMVPPAALYVSQILNTARSLAGSSSIEISDINFVKPLIVDPDVACEVQLSYRSKGASEFSVEITSQAHGVSVEDSESVDTHVVADVLLNEKGADPVQAVAELSMLRTACSASVAPDTIEEHMTAMSVDLGPSFHWFKTINRGQIDGLDTAIATLQVPTGFNSSFAAQLPAGLLDCLWQTALAALPEMPSRTVVPSSIEKLQSLSAIPSGDLTATSKILRQDEAGIIANVDLFDSTGRLLLSTQSIRLSFVDAEAFQVASPTKLYSQNWERQPLEEFDQTQHKAELLWIAGDDSYAQKIHSSLVRQAPLSSQIIASKTLPDAFIGKRVTYLCALAESEAPAERLLDALQTALEAACEIGKFSLVTSHAYALSQREDELLLNPAQSAAAGLALAYAHEAENDSTQVIDCDLSEASIDVVAAIVCGKQGVSLSSGEAGSARLMVRQGVAYSPFAIPERASMASAVGGGQSTDLVLFDPDSVQVVTGGAGGVGLATLEWMAERGARRFVISGRSSLGAVDRQRFSQPPFSSCSIEFVACDITQPDDVKRLAERVAQLGQLETVIHAAGIREDSLVESMTTSSLRAVIATKQGGAQLLEEMLDDLNPKLTLYYASIAGWLGAAGQGNYVAANAALDSLAIKRSAAGKPTLSIAWGPWQERGMTAQLSKAHQDRLRDLGYSTLSTSSAFETLDKALTNNLTGSVSILAAAIPVLSKLPGGKIFWQKQLSKWAVKSANEAAVNVTAPILSEALLVNRIAGLTTEDSLDALQSHLAQLVSDLAGSVSKADVDPAVGFFDLGLDSLGALEMRKKLEKDLGTKLKSTLLLDFPTVEKMAEELLRKIRPDQPALVKAAPVAKTVTDIEEDLSHEELVAMLARELES